MDRKTRYKETLKRRLKISDKAAEELIRAGLVTTRQARRAPREQLAAIDGIGVAAAKKIRGER